MSMFFFRLHNLRREEESRRMKNRGKVNRERRPPSPSSTRSESIPIFGHYTNAIIAGAGRLFEKPPLQPSDSLDEIALEIPRVRVEYYVNENTVKERLQIYFIKNQRSSLRIRIAYLFLKLLTCVLYISRVIMDRYPTTATCHGCPVPNRTDFRHGSNLSGAHFHDEDAINWDAILWVNRPFELWLMQVIIAYISLAQALLVVYLGYKGNLRQQICSGTFLLEMVNTLPFTITVFHPWLRNLFVPVFLNCWLAKNALQNLFNDLHRAMQRSQSALSQQLMILSATLLCLVFTSVCGIQHFQRAGFRYLDLFQATYYVVVTFSTVGYGDFVPDIWPSQLYMVLMICIALIVLPTQFEQLAFTWVERQKLGGSYSSHRAHHERHVVVCSTTINSDPIVDFLHEFYAHPRLEDHFVVLLSPLEVDNTMRQLLQIPMWTERATNIQGSCLKDSDLSRGRMSDAQACFILAARNCGDKGAADEHTILRAWALKDYAPNVPLFVQILRPENKIHVKFADYVICEDELKYALLANNCMIPAVSTLVTLLLHTSRGQEGQTSNEEWHRLYGQCSGNEVYHIRLEDSRFFGEYEGKSFTFASFHSHRKYGVSLIGIKSTDDPDNCDESLLLNPGPRHVMKKSDICFYMSITKEENSSFVVRPTNPAPPRIRGRGGFRAQPTVQIETEEGTEMTTLRSNIDEHYLNVPRSGEMSLLGPGTSSRRGSRRPSILPVPDNLAPPRSASDDDYDDSEDDDDLPDTLPWTTPCENIGIIKGFPPVSPYIGVTPTLCYLLREKKPICCLQLTQPCEHCTFRTAHEYNWPNKAIILAADYASNGIYNFIVPLRAHFRAKASLEPIVVLLERRPNPTFLNAISYFPNVYWMLGSIDSLDDLLQAGIVNAKTVVVVNKELSNSAEEDSLADCNTIIAVQTMFKYFPNITTITELSQSSNMRFMHFRPNDKYAHSLSKMEKKEKERGSHISYMFRLPFASGSVFSASMLDTLLYQAFVKDYVINFVRLLLGVDQAAGSGFLTSMAITKDDMWIRTYGRLYQKLCSTTFDIPIGIYRTEETPESDDGPEHIRRRFAHAQMVERAEIANYVRSRMESLNLPSSEYNTDGMDKPAKISYVIINPNCDLKLQEGDIIYLLRPSPFSARKTFERHNSRRKSNISTCSQQIPQQMPTQRMGPSTSRPSLSSVKANSLSLPESPQAAPVRGRSYSLRVTDDVMVGHSTSLRQGIGYKRKSSLEESGQMQPLKITLNDDIELEVTSPEDQVRPTFV